jgi:ribonucleoside-diphosphate reductase alpha chain
MAALEVPEEKLTDPAFDLLTHLGFSKADIEAANTTCLRRDDAGRRAAS